VGEQFHADGRNFTLEESPGYFQFDDIIEKLPGVYHAFALSTLGLVERLRESVDLRKATLVDICAGTGRCALTIAPAARHVYAVELQRGPSLFAHEQMKALGIGNVTYLRGDANRLPLRDRSVDHAVGMWGVVDSEEAERVVRPGGQVFLGGCAPGNMVGELSGMIGSLYGIPDDSPMADLFFGDSDQDHGVDEKGYHWIDFDYVADYGTPEEAARLLGRVYGPQVGHHLEEQKMSTVRWRLRLSSRSISA